MDEEWRQLMADDRLLRLLAHYQAAGGVDRTAWADRVMSWEDGDAELTRRHGALLAAAWVEVNAGSTAGAAPGRVPGCYRLTPAGRQALKRAVAARDDLADESNG
ncbi:MAG TPA: hypothetical protein VGF55_24935 [Gemmataceae bacterium]|jgi:hypothetical protein